MWLAFIIALMLELLKKAKTIGTAIKYIVVTDILTMLLSLIMALITPTEATELAMHIYVLVTTAYAVLGLIVGKILRAITRGG